MIEPLWFSAHRRVINKQVGGILWSKNSFRESTVNLTSKIKLVDKFIGNCLKADKIITEQRSFLFIFLVIV